MSRNRAHAVSSLVPDRDTAPTGTILIGETAVGVKAIGELVGQLAQFVGAMVAAKPRQLDFRFLARFHIDEVGQPMTKAADHCHVSRPETSGSLRLGGGGQDRL